MVLAPAHSGRGVDTNSDRQDPVGQLDFDREQRADELLAASLFLAGRFLGHRMGELFRA